MSIKTSLQIAENRVSIMAEELAMLNRDERFTEEHRAAEAKRIRADSEHIIVDELRQARKRATQAIEQREAQLADARIEALRVRDVATFSVMRDSFRAQLMAATDNAFISDRSPIAVAQDLRTLVDRAGTDDERKALRAAILEVAPSWTANEAIAGDARGIMGELMEESSNSPQVQAAAKALDEARATLVDIDNVARRISEQIDPSDARQAMATGQRTRIENAMLGRSSDPYEVAGIVNVDAGIPRGEGGSDDVGDVYGIVGRGDRT